MNRTGIRRAALLVVLSFAWGEATASATNDPIRLYGGAKKFHDEWAQRAAETEKQLSAARDRASKAHDAADIDRPIREMERRADEIRKEARGGIKEALKSAYEGKTPWEAAKSALKILFSFKKEMEAEGKFEDIAIDVDGVMERAAEAQREVNTLRQTLKGQLVLVAEAQAEMDRLASSVSMSSQMVAWFQQVGNAVAAAQQRQQQRLAAEAEAAKKAAEAKARAQAAARARAQKSAADAEARRKAAEDAATKAAEQHEQKTPIGPQFPPPAKPPAPVSGLGVPGAPVSETPGQGTPSPTPTPSPSPPPGPAIPPPN